MVNDIVQFFAANWAMLLSFAWNTLVLSLISLGTAIVLGLPLGVWVGHLHRFSFLAINGGNVLRALPTLALIAIGIGLYGLGFVNIFVALVILAFPLILTNAYVGVDTVDRGIIEAATGMGLTGWQILLRVELPNAVPLIMAGIRTAAVYVLATSYLAGFAGYPDTLGDIIVNISGYRLPGVLAAALVVIVMAFLGEWILAGVERWLTPRGIKLARNPEVVRQARPATN